MIPGSGRSPGEGTGYTVQYSWASLVAQLVKNPPAMQKTWVRSLGWEDPLEWGKSYPLQYSGLENSMDCIVHEVAKSRTQLSDFYFRDSVIQSVVQLIATPRTEEPTRNSQAEFPSSGDLTTQGSNPGLLRCRQSLYV